MSAATTASPLPAATTNKRFSDEEYEHLRSHVESPLDGWTAGVEKKGRYAMWRRKPLQTTTADGAEVDAVYEVRGVLHINAPLHLVFPSVTHPPTRMKWDPAFARMTVLEELTFEEDEEDADTVAADAVAAVGSADDGPGTDTNASTATAAASPTAATPNSNSVAPPKRAKRHGDTTYTVISAPFPLTDRDSLQARSWQHDVGRSFTYVFKSIVDHSLKPPDPSYVRSESAGVFIGEAVNDENGQPTRTCLKIFMKNNPKGNIPAFVVNTVAPRVARSWVERLLAFCEDAFKQQQKRNVQ